MLRHVFVFILTLLAIMHSRAETKSAPKTQTKQVQVKKSEPAFKMAYDFGFSSNLKSTTSTESEQSLALELAPTYNFTKSLSAFSSIILEHTTTSEYNDLTLLNAPLGLSKSFEIDPTLKINLTAAAILPLNYEANQISSFNGGYYIGTGFSKATSIANKSTTLSGLINGYQNFHEYETSSAGEANLSYKGRIRGVIQTELTSKLSVGLLAQYEAGRTYENSLRTNFRIDESIAYSLNKKSSVYLAHSNAGSALQSDGTESNIDVFDKNTSTVSVGLTGAF